MVINKLTIINSPGMLTGGGVSGRACSVRSSYGTPPGRVHRSGRGHRDTAPRRAAPDRRHSPPVMARSSSSLFCDVNRIPHEELPSCQSRSKCVNNTRLQHSLDGICTNQGSVIWPVEWNTETIQTEFIHKHSNLIDNTLLTISFLCLYVVLSLHQEHFTHKWRH